jgi:hypothetical protein
VIDEKRLDEMEERLRNGEETLRQVVEMGSGVAAAMCYRQMCYRQTQESLEFIRLARLGLEYERAKAANGFAVITNADEDAPAEALLLDYKRSKALAEWAEKYGAPAVDLVLRNISLDWYVQQFGRDEAPTPTQSGAVAVIHNAALVERLKSVLQFARKALAALNALESR